MSRDDIQKLLGGYATNTLTEQERRDLFEAALTDQALFNALTDEHALKELLDDPRSRRLLIEALKTKQPRRSWFHTLQPWLQRPSSWAFAGSVAVALLALTLVIRLSGPLPEPPMIADSKAPAPPSSPKVTEPPSTTQSEARRAEDALSAAKKDGEDGSTERARAPSGRQEKAVAKTRTTPVNKEGELASRAPQAVAPKEPGPAPAEPPLKEQQELRGTAEGSAPESHTRESFTSAAEPKMPEVDKIDDPKLEAGTQTPQREALGKAHEEGSRLAPMARAAKPKDMMSKAEPSMFRYSIMKKEVAGHYSEAQPTTIFQHGDQVRLAIEPDDNGYLYVLAQDVAGNSKVIFPPEGPTATARVEKKVQYLIPPTGDFTFEQPGDLRLTMIFSREPLADVRNLLESPVPAEKKAQPDAGAFGSSKDRPRGTAEALDLLARRSESSSLVRREITLKHQ